MKLFAILSIVALSSFAHAQTPAPQPGGEFEKRKSEHLADIDERIGKLQEHRGCVAASADVDAMKNCRLEMKEYRHAERMERMNKRKGRMEEKMKKMDEKMKKMDEKMKNEAAKGGSGQ